MDRYKLLITGGTPLRGETSVFGGKNTSVAVLPATLLCDEPCVVENLPDIEDVHVVRDMLELLGAVVMSLMIRVPLRVKKLDLNPLLATFVSTVVSGGSFVVFLFAFMHMETSGLVAYIPIVLGTAAIGSVLVQLLYLPLKKVLKK